MTIVFLGPPACGKGTQARLLKEHQGLYHIPVGELLKQEQNKEQSVILAQGHLLGDEIVNGLVKRILDKVDVSKVLLDGFPRTIPQAEFLDFYLGNEASKLKVVLFDIAYEALTERIGGRLVCERCGSSYHTLTSPTKIHEVCDHCGGRLVRRLDDDAEVFKRRILSYEAYTFPLIQYYGTRLYRVNASKDIHELHHDIVKVMSCVI